MVIGDRFAWGHLPKTGGEATRTMFSLFPELVRFSDPKDTYEQHTTFREREEQVRGKLLALNLRRLPSWVISREQHKARWGLWPEQKPLPIDPPDQLAASSFPDYRLNTFLDDGRFAIDRWLRMETLADDFLAFVSELAEVPEDARARLAEVGRVNANEYERELSSWFTQDQVEQLYASNPLWAGIERQVYGEILVGVGR